MSRKQKLAGFYYDVLPPLAEFRRLQRWKANEALAK